MARRYVAIHHEAGTEQGTGWASLVFEVEFAVACWLLEWPELGSAVLLPLKLVFGGWEGAGCWSAGMCFELGAQLGFLAGP